MPSEKRSLDFNTLSSHFRLLPVSPAWSTVEPALSRLQLMKQNRQSYAQMDADIRCVHDFAEVLRRSQRYLADALLCGAIVGKSASLSHSGQRLQHGLRVISTIYKFEAKSQSHIEKNFRDLREKIAERWPQLHDTFAALDTAMAKQDWKVAVNEVEKIQAFSLPDLDNATLQRSAQAALQQRLDQFFQTGAPAEPDLDGLLGLAASLRINALVDLEPQKMTIAAWSAALLAGLEDRTPTDPDFCPLWVALASLHALGFSLESDSTPDSFRSWLIENGQLTQRPLPLEQIPSWSWLWRPEPERSVLLVKAPDTSVFDALMPSTGFASMAVTLQQAQELLSRLQNPPKKPPLSPSFQLLAFEASAVSEPEAQQLFSKLSAFSVDIRRVFVYAKPPRPDEPPGPFIPSAPTKLDDLFVSPRKSARRDEASA